MKYWLVKQEPSAYAWSEFVEDGRTSWTGVRNFAARNHLRSMSEGDWVFYYHSGEGREIVGLARVARAAYPDPTAGAGEGEWVCVDLTPLVALRKPVGLSAIKADSRLQSLGLVKQSRLSVMPVEAEQFSIVLSMSGTPRPARAGRG